MNLSVIGNSDFFLSIFQLVSVLCVDPDFVGHYSTA